MLHNVRIVLVATTHPGNIGAVARAMKTMGLEQLYLVRPKIFPDVAATARAAGADDILEHACVVDDLSAAVYDCHLIIGTSVRLRDMPLPLLHAREAAQKVVAEGRARPQCKMAVVFGRESNGLTNEELLQCHYHLHIPTNTEFSSLNVAAAVQIVTYEIMMAYQASIVPCFNGGCLDSSPAAAYDALATGEEMELFYAHLEEVLSRLEFLRPEKSKKLLARLRRLFNRARLEHLEVNILRGILTAVRKERP